MQRKKQPPKLIAVVGPTVSGKSALGIALAKQFDGEVISADSRQIYKGMDIGTAKIKRDTQQDDLPKSIGALQPFRSEKIVHWLIDIVEPNEMYTLAHYQRDAYKVIADIHARGKIPFIVGGTGLYVSAVIDHFTIPQGSDTKHQQIRKELENRYAQEGLSILFQELMEHDPDAVWRVDRNNPRRVIRALEVCLLTGKPFTKQRQQHKSLYDVLQIGIATTSNERSVKIEKRVREMLAEGFVEEVHNLLKRGYALDLPSLSGIGYKEIGEWLENGGSTDTKVPEEIIEKICIATRQYAKRQMTWLKRDKRIQWIKNIKEAEGLVNDFLC